MSKPIYKTLAAFGAGALMFGHDQFEWTWPYPVVLAVTVLGIIFFAVAASAWCRTGIAATNKYLTTPFPQNSMIYINSTIITLMIISVSLVIFYSTSYGVTENGKRTTFSDVFSLKSALALRLAVPEAVVWGPPRDGLYPLTWTVEAFGKYVANGVLTRIKADKPIEKIEIIGATVFLPQHIVQLPKEEQYERFYFRHPHGKYRYRILAKNPTDVTFVYKFDGEPEGPSVTWKVSKP